MTPADRDSYRRQFDAAQKRLPRGHVIWSCTWRDGQLATLSHKPERQQAEPQFAPRVRRGAAQQGLFD
jgi:hypothetical protein